MATYFARKAGNINAADVWSTTPSGSATAVTFASGDVLMANSFTITVNVSTNLGGAGELRNDTTGGATGGGTFSLADGVTITANIFGGSVASTNCVTANPSFGQNVYVVGNITGGTANNAIGLSNASGTGTINVTGNISGRNTTASNALGTGCLTSNLIVTGNVTGGSGTGSNSEGIRVAGTGNLFVTGVVTGGTAASAFGVRGNSSGNITVFGQAVGGVAAPGIENNQTGQVTVTRAVGNGFGGASVGLSAAFGVSNVVSQSSITVVEQLEFGALGQSPVNGRIRLKKMGTNAAIFNFCDTAGAKTLIDATANAAMPAATDVRSGVSYASGALSGSCAVPAASSVAFGVPVDNTTGTALLTGAAVATAVWGAATRSITGGTVDTLTNAPASVTPSDIWSHASRTVTGGTVDTLTNAPTVPSVVQIRQEMDANSTKLANLDTTVSSRLAPSGTLATVTNLTNAPASVTPSDIWSHSSRTLTTSSGPTAVEIRQEIDANSTKLDAAISSRMAASEATKLDSIKGKTDLLNTDRLSQVATTNIVGTLLAQANS